MRYYLWALFLILNPFYWFPSGTPQVSDYLMITVMVFSGSVLGLGFKRATFKKRSLLMFLGYTFLANLTLYIIYFSGYKGVPLISTIFYLYNALVLLYVIGLANMNIRKFVKFTQYGIVFSVAIQIGYYLLFGSENFDDLRPSFFFTTPNQLGYYALLMLSIFVILNKLDKVNLIFFIVVFLACLLITLISASKAAVGGILFLSVFYLFDSQILKGNGLIAVIVIFSISFYFVVKNEQGVNQTAYVLERVDDGSKRENITEWEYRGYDRINNHPYFLILGSGEGMYERFDTYITKHEMHSSFGNLIFSYGIPGFALFLVFFFSLFKGLKMRTGLYVMPVILYSLTHMGLRFTPFWILLAMFPIIYMLTLRRRYYKLQSAKAENT
jgi:hypothetical protein